MEGGPPVEGVSFRHPPLGATELHPVRGAVLDTKDTGVGISPWGGERVEVFIHQD